ncbi:MAG TPA: 4Fe-4S dicluster domain-containing protein [Kofleriaceae bacterium]|nr:4Fe-4S dicluster domain-containing protein [Kofleriaceae bacterium]
MFKSLRVRLSQGRQFIPDVRSARPIGFRGLPKIAPGPCGAGCDACAASCPTGAIRIDPVSIDLGRCIFCSECVIACPEAKIELTPEPRMGSASREDLVVTASAEERTKIRANEGFAKLFKRSLKLRQVSAGGCNGCELELNATANVNFDLQRYGIEWVASPRHADALVLSGTLTRTMKDAVRLAWDAMSEPRFVVAVGACAISGGLYDGAHGVERSFLDEVIPALYVPGCPPHPLTFVNAILDVLGVP